MTPKEISAAAQFGLEREALEQKRAKDLVSMMQSAERLGLQKVRDLANQKYLDLLGKQIEQRIEEREPVTAVEGVPFTRSELAKFATRLLSKDIRTQVQKDYDAAKAAGFEGGFNEFWRQWKDKAYRQWTLAGRPGKFEEFQPPGRTVFDLGEYGEKRGMSEDISRSDYFTGPKYYRDTVKSMGDELENLMFSPQLEGLSGEEWEAEFNRLKARLVVKRMDKEIRNFYKRFGPVYIVDEDNDRIPEYWEVTDPRGKQITIPYPGD